MLAFLAIAAFFLLTEHQAHLWGVVPWFLLLACPLLHFFMHGRHGGHGRGGSHAGHEGGAAAWGRTLGGGPRRGEGMSQPPAYGLWALVVINSLVFLVFAFSFTRPRSARDWRSFGAFAAFMVALFTEMYGVPLTIYLLWGWLAGRVEGLDLLSHDAGHLWQTLLGWKSDSHVNPIHLLSGVLIGGGFILLARAWTALHEAQREHRLATAGPYQRIRHPQYAAFMVIMLGFLVQWPTLLTLAMFPLLAWMYLRLARAEEREAAREFGDEWRRWAARTPAWFPWPHAGQGDRRDIRVVAVGLGKGVEWITCCLATSCGQWMPTGGPRTISRLDRSTSSTTPCSGSPWGPST